MASAAAASPSSRRDNENDNNNDNGRKRKSLGITSLRLWIFIDIFTFGRFYDTRKTGPDTALIITRTKVGGNFVSNNPAGHGIGQRPLQTISGFYSHQPIIN